MRKFFRNEKGQAFDVFKLLIAAIVAVAILWILLSILDIEIFPFLNNPNDEAGKLVSQLYTGGGRNYMISGKLNFTEENPFLDSQAIAEQATGISRDQVCVSRGVFMEREGTFEVPNELGSIKFVGSGNQPARLLAFCDSGSQLSESLVTAAGSEAANWYNDCTLQEEFVAACSGSQRCCIVAIKYE